MLFWVFFSCHFFADLASTGITFTTVGYWVKYSTSPWTCHGALPSVFTLCFRPVYRGLDTFSVPTVLLTSGRPEGMARLDPSPSRVPYTKRPRALRLHQGAPCTHVAFRYSRISFVLVSTFRRLKFSMMVSCGLVCILSVQSVHLANCPDFVVWEVALALSFGINGTMLVWAHIRTLCSIWWRAGRMITWWN